jgi:hypothetical protein
MKKGKGAGQERGDKRVFIPQRLREREVLCDLTHCESVMFAVMSHCVTYYFFCCRSLAMVHSTRALA